MPNVAVLFCDQRMELAGRNRVCYWGTEKTASEEAQKVSVSLPFPMRLTQVGRRSWLQSSHNPTEARVLLFPSRGAQIETSDPGKVLISSLRPKSLRLKIRSQKNPSVATRWNVSKQRFELQDTGSRKHASISLSLLAFLAHCKQRAGCKASLHQFEV